MQTWPPTCVCKEAHVVEIKFPAIREEQSDHLEMKAMKGGKRKTVRKLERSAIIDVVTSFCQ
jgi:hypothetical protein